MEIELYLHCDKLNVVSAFTMCGQLLYVRFETILATLTIQVPPPLKLHSQNKKVSFIGPYHLPKILGTKAKSTTKVTLRASNQGPLDFETAAVSIRQTCNIQCVLCLSH